ncbi:GNAT family N-acetyltransferase [Pseudoroseomonas cervicalis]|uniref:GNAT family N-acetyltransferase n=1 Tax=Teichococcus cervicalis TaxID=204525 RepID=UPI002786EEF9|nr:GNAT family N-acetyltransferase [Pseudoroseomonas cervicalis]MDQ1079853.1 GNAT superfamily N-acetyltransferase [Pseudoroseomonas cervicalis]
MRSETERQRYHALRENCIFDLYHRADGPYPCRYDPGHPDERDPANHPLILAEGDAVLGTIRIDMKPDGRAVLRLIAIDPAQRGAGLGALLLAEAEAYARRLGASRLCVNARRPAMGFYARSGFQPGAWEGQSRCPEAVAMLKPLGGLQSLSRSGGATATPAWRHAA